MTRKELLPLLIAHYEKVIKEVTENTWGDTCYHIITKNSVDRGICYCANRVFNVNIYDKKWVKKAGKKDEPYWCLQPSWWTSKENNIERLQFRVDKMKKLIQ